MKDEAEPVVTFFVFYAKLPKKTSKAQLVLTIGKLKQMFDAYHLGQNWHAVTVSLPALNEHCQFQYYARVCTRLNHSGGTECIVEGTRGVVTYGLPGVVQIYTWRFNEERQMQEMPSPTKQFAVKLVHGAPSKGKIVADYSSSCNGTLFTDFNFLRQLIPLAKGTFLSVLPVQSNSVTTCRYVHLREQKQYPDVPTMEFKQKQKYQRVLPSAKPDTVIYFNEKWGKRQDHHEAQEILKPERYFEQLALNVANMDSNSSDPDRLMRIGQLKYSWHAICGFKNEILIPCGFKYSRIYRSWMVALCHLPEIEKREELQKIIELTTELNLREHAQEECMKSIIGRKLLSESVRTKESWSTRLKRKIALARYETSKNQKKETLVKGNPPKKSCFSKLWKKKYDISGGVGI